jgi:hypothetical protein
MVPAGISLMRLPQAAVSDRGARYPEPEMLPELPGDPLFGIKANEDWTVNVAVAVSPNGVPTADTTYAPPLALDLTVKLQGVDVPELYCIEPLETVHVKVGAPTQRALVPSGNVGFMYGALASVILT